MLEILGDVSCDSYSSNPRVKKYSQRTKMLMSSNLGLVDFDVGLVDFILHLPNRQVKVLVEFFFWLKLNLIHYTCQNFLG